MVKAADSKAWVYKRVNDGILQSPLSSGSTVSLTNGNWYTGKVVVGDDLGNSALQRLGWRGLPAREQDRRRRLAGRDARPTHTWSDETALLDTTTVDDDWSAGYTGLFHGHIASTAAQDFDDVKIGYDNNADLDIDDAGDSIVINDDFASNSTTLSYDDNGNLTDDGLFKFAYDAWNRLVALKSRYSSGTTQTTFATYAYDGANRRTSKVVTNNGVEVYPNDGGNTTVHFYYGGLEEVWGLAEWPIRWNVFETRNGSNQTTWQYFWGTQYVDEIIFTDKNGDPTVGNDCDPDGSAGEGSESPADHRYLYHQDRNSNVVALTDYGTGVHGAIVERYARHASYATLTQSPIGAVSQSSKIGTVFGMAGAVEDADRKAGHMRERVLASGVDRFQQRDPLGYFDSANLYTYASLNPLSFRDSLGLQTSRPAPTVPRIQIRLHDFGLNVYHVGVDIVDGDPKHPKKTEYDYGLRKEDGQNCVGQQGGGGRPIVAQAPNLTISLPANQFEIQCIRDFVKDNPCLGPYRYIPTAGDGTSNSNGAIRAMLDCCFKRGKEEVDRVEGTKPGWDLPPPAKCPPVG